jgi:iron(III) transport system permease protein
VLSVVVLLVAFAVLAVIGIAVFGSLVRFWPYNMSLGLHNYTKILFNPEELQTLINSLLLATAAAMVGTALVMTSGWLVARKVGEPKLNQVLHGFAMVPLAVPGLVLGLGYVFFFNNPSNPLHFLQATMALLVMCTIAHYYTVPHLMAVGALVRFDAELDFAGTALKSEPIQTARRIYLPILAPTLIDIAGYFFVNAMTTVSALIFLFTAENRVSAIAVINMTEGSRIGQATALAVLMMAICVAVAGLQTLLRNYIIRKQTWRRRTV